MIPLQIVCFALLAFAYAAPTPKAKPGFFAAAYAAPFVAASAPIVTAPYGYYSAAYAAPYAYPAAYSAYASFSAPIVLG